MPSFLSPLFLIGSLAAAVPLVLHLLRREPEPRVKFAAVRLLRGAPVELSQKRRLRELVLLALRVAALVLLAIAFARPFVVSPTAVAPSGTTLIALDTSYSMSASATFERAQQLARGAIDRAGSGELVGIMTFADAPIVTVAPGSDRAVARAAVDAARPGFGATRYRSALGAAVQAIGARGTIVLVTDLQESGWDVGDRVSVPESVRLEVLDTGAVRSNLAVTAMRAAGDRIIASVLNTGDAVRETRAHLLLDGRQAAESAVTVAPGATVEVGFSGASGATSGATSVTVTVDDRDGLAADNARYLIRDDAARSPVLVVTSTGNLRRDAFYLQQALAVGASTGESHPPDVRTAAQLSLMDAPQLSAHSAVLLLSSRGLERRGRELLAGYVTAGGGLLLAVGPDIDGEVVGGVLGEDAPLRIAVPADERALDRSLVETDGRHPIFKAFPAGTAAFGLATFRRIAHIEGGRCQTIARFTTGEAALLSCDPGHGRAVVVASDLDGRWNDFPLHATFVPFVHETLTYLSSGRALEGPYLVADVPNGVPPIPGFATIHDTARAANGARRVAVNVDPRESEAGRLSVEEFQRVVTRLKESAVPEAKVEARRQEDRQHLWRYALGLVLAVLALEGVVASRTA